MKIEGLATKLIGIVMMLPLTLLLIISIGLAFYENIVIAEIIKTGVIAILSVIAVVFFGMGYIIFTER